MSHAPPHRPVALFLRCIGWLDLCALAAVVAPGQWLADVHRFLGLGEFPDEPIALYLARMASALYAMHGAILVYVSYDVERYWNLIRFLAIVMLIQGAAVLVVDQTIALPAWWRWGEGPSFAAAGVVILILQRRVAHFDRAGPGGPQADPDAGRGVSTVTR